MKGYELGAGDEKGHSLRDDDVWRLSCEGSGHSPPLGLVLPMRPSGRLSAARRGHGPSQRWALDAEGQPTPRHRGGSWGRSAGMLTHHVSACICEGNPGRGGRFAEGLVTSALQPVTPSLQARHAKYIFASQIPSATGICVVPVCNVRQTPSFFPFGSSLSCPVERFFDRAVHIPDLTDIPPAGNSPQKTSAPPLEIISNLSAHLESRSAQ